MTRFTLAGRWQFDSEVKHSRFRAIAEPLTEAGQAAARIEALSDPGASHACWAYRFGQDYRSSDAGEPAGTAGRPILAAIDGQGMDRVVVVVLRWFGGVKLGVGGLVRAYGGAAAECLRRAPRVPIVDRVSAGLRCGFEHADPVYRLLAGHRATVIQTRFDSAGMQLRIELPREAIETLRVELGEATRGRAGIDLEP